MLTSPDFRELLSILARFNVRYLVVGGYAVMRYTEPRFTKDLDVMMSIPGVEFEEAWVERQESHVEGLTIPFISREHLLRSKIASGRQQDLLDAENLRKTAEADDGGLP